MEHLALTNLAVPDFIAAKRSVWEMSQLDVRALEANFDAWRSERMLDAPIHEAFERYAIEAVLKNADLGDDEINSGMLGVATTAALMPHISW